MRRRRRPEYSGVRWGPFPSDQLLCNEPAHSGTEVANSRQAVTSILIADRDEAIALLLETAIRRVLPCQIVLAHEPSAATEALRSNTFDVVLLDIGMYSDGLATLQHIDGHNARTEVIALTTGVISSTLLKTLAKAEVAAVVAKPFDLNQVVGLVIQAVHERENEADANLPLVFRTAGDKPTFE